MTGTVAQPDPFAHDVKDWEHLDGSVCDAGFLAPTAAPPGDPTSRWWCTEHQQTLLARAHEPLCVPDRAGADHDNECECWCHEGASA